MNNENAIHEMMTVTELAQYLRISKPTAYALVNEGKIPSARFGRQIRIYRGDILDMCHKAGCRFY
jgi:excisionase family DNA binding protein